MQNFSSIDSEREGHYTISETELEETRIENDSEIASEVPDQVFIF